MPENPSPAAAADAGDIGQAASAGKAASAASNNNPTPLERRAWVQQAQRAVRMAVTGMKSVRLRYNDCADEGERQLNTACNLSLQLLHMPSLPLGALASLPGLKEAAGAKLTRLLAQQLQQLHGCCAQLQALCKESQQHAHSLQPLLQESWQQACTDTLQPGLGLSSASCMLQQVADGIAADVHDKAAVVSVLAQHAHAHTASTVIASNATPHSTIPHPTTPHPTTATTPASAATAVLPVDQITQRCQVWLSVWLLSPRLDASKEEMALGILSAALA